MTSSFASRLTSLLPTLGVAVTAGALLAGCSGATDDDLASDTGGIGSSSEAWVESATGNFTSSRLRLVDAVARPFAMRLDYGSGGGCLLMSPETFALVYPGYAYRAPRCYTAYDREVVAREYATPASPFEMPDELVRTPSPLPDFTVRVTGMRLNSLTATLESDGLHLRGNAGISVRAYSWLVNPSAELSSVNIDARIVTANGMLATDQVRIDLGPWNVSCGALDWCNGYVSDAIANQRRPLEVRVQNTLNRFLWRNETYGYVYDVLSRVENTLNAGSNPTRWVARFGSLRFEGGAFRYDMARTGLSSAPACEVRVGCGSTAVVQCTADADRFTLEEGARLAASAASTGRGGSARMIDRSLTVDGKRHAYRVCAMSNDAAGVERSRSCTTIGFSATEAPTCKGAAPAPAPATGKGDTTTDPTLASR